MVVFEGAAMRTAVVQRLALLRNCQFSGRTRKVVEDEGTSDGDTDGTHAGDFTAAALRWVDGQLNVFPARTASVGISSNSVVFGRVVGDAGGNDDPFSCASLFEYCAHFIF